MKLQFLIPHYKETEDVIRPLLDSIKNQIGINFTDVGAIIVSDGSLVELTEQFLNKYPFKIQHIKSEHVGVSEARNIALRNATADYVMFCDADDRFYNMLGLYFINKEITTKQFDVYVSKFVSEKYNKETGEIKYFNIDENDVTFVHGKVFRREHLVDNAIYWNAELRVHEDCYFNSLAQILSQETRRSDKPFYLWCYNKNSVSRSDENFVINTYTEYLKSRFALVEELVKRGVLENAAWQLAATAYQAYYRCNTDVVFYSDKYGEIRNYFLPLYHKYEYLLQYLPKEENARLIKDIHNEAVLLGLTMERVLFEDWIKD